MNDEMMRIRDVAARWLHGVSPDQIAVETGCSSEHVTDVITRLEAVVVLLAHGFPEPLIARAARISTDEARVCIEEVRSRAKTPEQIHELAATRGLLSDAKGAPLAAGAASSAEPGEEATQALEVLDFWASKWL